MLISSALTIDKSVSNTRAVETRALDTTSEASSKHERTSQLHHQHLMESAMIGCSTPGRDGFSNRAPTDTVPGRQSTHKGHSTTADEGIDSQEAI